VVVAGELREFFRCVEAKQQKQQQEQELEQE